MYITDDQGKWSTRKGKKYLLIEPSQEYVTNQQEEQLLQSLIPTKEEIQQAEFEIKTIELLTSLEVII